MDESVRGAVLENAKGSREAAFCLEFSMRLHEDLTLASTLLRRAKETRQPEAVRGGELRHSLRAGGSKSGRWPPIGASLSRHERERWICCGQSNPDQRSWATAAARLRSCRARRSVIPSARRSCERAWPGLSRLSGLSQPWWLSRPWRPWRPWRPCAALRPACRPGDAVRRSGLRRGC